MRDPLDISHEISSALGRNEPVVALESSVIAQGLPSPHNVKTALAMEDKVRAAGAVPATIGVIDGKIRVGLTKEEIERLGEGKAAKLATRDLLYAVAKKLDGGATVSATARIASAAGIGVMATGGIGGVHKDFADSHDISADLWELARTPIIIVCSGVKAVQDIAATMEWLETHGVPVFGCDTDEMPAFYQRSCGIPVPRVDGTEGVAEIARLFGGTFGMRCALIIAVPIPVSAEIDVSDQIDKAAQEARAEGVRGKDLTPWLLNRINELTEGKSLKANIALLKNNAEAAAEIACAVVKDTERRMGFMV